MIAKCTKGRSVYGGLSYDVGPGRAEEHHNPHQIAGNVAGRNWRERAYAMDEHARSARPDVTRPVHRTALRLADDDRRLSDKEWRQVAERYVTEMGFADCPWTAMRHGEEHIHVTVSRVQWDGKLASDAHDFRRSHQAARVVEREHGLIDASERANTGRPQVQSGERARAERTGEVAPRDDLRDRLDTALARSDGSRAGYEAAMTDSGVRFAANEASTGRMNGYRYGVAGHTDSHGEQVWFKGSQLGRDYTWTATQRRLEEHQPGRDGRDAGSVGARGQAATRARSALDRIKAGRGEGRPEAARYSSQEPAPRLTTTGDTVDETRPAGATGPRRERRADQPAAGRETGRPPAAAEAAGPGYQPPAARETVEDEREAAARTTARLAIARMRQKELEQGRDRDRGRER